MTTPTTAKEIRTDSVINLPGKFMDGEKINAYLVDIFSLWEQGKTATANGLQAAPPEWQKIVERSRKFILEIATTAIDEVSGPLSQVVHKVASEHAFADGVRQGTLIEQGRAIGRAAFAEGQARKGQGSKPDLPAKLSPAGPPALDSQAILKTIGEEMRKMFDAGMEQGKATAVQIGEAAKQVQPSSEIIRVQRNAAGEMVGAVREFVYQEGKETLPSA